MHTAIPIPINSRMMEIVLKVFRNPSALPVDDFIFSSKRGIKVFVFMGLVRIEILCFHVSMQQSYKKKQINCLYDYETRMREFSANSERRFLFMILAVIFRYRVEQTYLF